MVRTLSRYHRSLIEVSVLLLLGSPVAHAVCQDQDKNNRTLADELGISFDFTLELDACPVNKARVRKPDALAKEGGGFYSARGVGACHFALDLELVPDTPIEVQYGLGDPVFAAADGVVVLASKTWGPAGQTVIIDHGKHLYTLYAHLNAINAKVGTKLRAGEKLGNVGYSGNATALKKNNQPPHLHFTVFSTKEPIANWKPLALVKESEKVDDALPFMNGYGFIDPSNRLYTLGCM